MRIIAIFYGELAPINIFIKQFLVQWIKKILLSTFLIDLFVCLFDFLTSSSTFKLYHGRVTSLTSDNFTRACCHTRKRQSGDTMTSVSAVHIILTPTQSVGCERPQRVSNPGPPHQESCALPTELRPPP